MHAIIRNRKCIAITAAIMMIMGIIMAVIPAAVVKADSFPTIPNQFYGTVKNNGSLVSSGYAVVAKVGGTTVATTTTDSSGQYGYNSAFYVATDDGNTIEFYVNGVEATQTATASAGSAIQINLTVTGATATTTATTTTTTTSTADTSSTASSTATTGGNSSSGATNSAVVVVPQNNQSQPPAVSQSDPVNQSHPTQSQVSTPAQSPVNTDSESNGPQVPLVWVIVGAAGIIVLMIVFRIIKMVRR